MNYKVYQTVILENDHCVRIIEVDENNFTI